MVNMVGKVELYLHHCSTLHCTALPCTALSNAYDGYGRFTGLGGQKSVIQSFSHSVFQSFSQSVSQSISQSISMSLFSTYYLFKGTIGKVVPLVPKPKRTKKKSTQLAKSSQKLLKVAKSSQKYQKVAKSSKKQQKVAKLTKSS